MDARPGIAFTQGFLNSYLQRRQLDMEERRMDRQDQYYQSLIDLNRQKGEYYANGARGTTVNVGFPPSQTSTIARGAERHIASVPVTNPNPKHWYDLGNLFGLTNKPDMRTRDDLLRAYENYKAEFGYDQANPAAQKQLDAIWQSYLSGGDIDNEWGTEAAPPASAAPPTSSTAQPPAFAPTQPASAAQPPASAATSPKMKPGFGTPFGSMMDVAAKAKQASPAEATPAFPKPEVMRPTEALAFAAQQPENPQTDPAEISIPTPIPDMIGVNPAKVTRDNKVWVISPDGKTGKIPLSQYKAARQQGYKELR